MRNTVLIPGFWHGAWSWSLVAEQLAARNLASVALDLEGQGLEGVSPAGRWGRPFDAGAFAQEPSPAAAVTATSAAGSLIRRLRLIGDGEPCVVVAHSMAGVVATLAAELEPALFAHLVYVAALAPVSGVPAGAYVGSEENAGELGTGLLQGDPAAIGASRIDPGDPAGQAAIREAFYADVDPITAGAAIGLLNTDAPVGIAAEAFAVTPQRFGSVPHTYVTCAQDNMIRLPLQERFVREIDAVSARPTTVVPLDTSHSPFLSRPEALAGVIAGVG
ncbi:peptidase M13 [Kineosporia sp. NBRC 101677]|uniref:alpha/beta fold hydrolase n=1 Tax=Kineosporia sp. NBRC 101677 TaxID=3032197 RepID=UPI0024A37C1E|nr:alpha/beta hydrolase [Kineosporia sp. NBRC 101677]GLY17676.1 peptidase M13 [Kineosporia sp. NBRC 101677]